MAIVAGRLAPDERCVGWIEIGTYRKKTVSSSLNVPVIWATDEYHLHHASGGAGCPFHSTHSAMMSSFRRWAARRIPDWLPPATLAGQSPSSGAVGTAGAIAAFTALLASLKTSLDAAFVLFVFLALSGEMAVGSQCSAKRDFALASSHAFCWYSTTAIKAVAKMTTATMIQAIRKGVLSRQHLGRRRRFIRKTILFQFNSPVPLKARQAELPVRSVAGRATPRPMQCAVNHGAQCGVSREMIGT
jgi:hypothetical protein